MRLVFLGAILALGLSSAVQAASVLVNGGFETGDFSGWRQRTINTASTCQVDWHVAATDNHCQFTNTTLNAANEGDFAVYNTFDGAGPVDFVIEQDVNLSEGPMKSATLGFDLTYGWNMVGGTDPRMFSLAFYDTAGLLIGSAFDLIVDPTIAATGFVDWTSYSTDVLGLLADFAGETVTLRATVLVSQYYTGPASLGLDALSLDIDVGAVPIPASGLMLLLGLGGFAIARRRNA